ncbi:MAG TPA: ATPase, T2SS/T4P/T4SS family [Terriglobia bacterium]|nr:ATPase, T2SS/T4P/T4SS family [Terriglobia bacterium]
MEPTLNESTRPNLIPEMGPGTESPVDDSDAIGVLLVKGGFLSETQLTYARRVRSKLSSSKTLFSVLKELEFVTETQLHETLAANPGTIRLGDLLVELEVLQKTQLEVALDLQHGQAGGKRLGEILIERRFIDSEKLSEVLAIQCGISQIELRFGDIDKKLLTKEAYRACCNHVFVPIHRKDGHAVVAFADPTDDKSRTVAARLFGQDLIPAIASWRAINEVLSAYERGTKEQQTASANDSEVVRFVENMFSDAVKEGASDIHIEPAKEHLRIRFRSDGVMIPYKELGKELLSAVTSRIKILANADIAEKRRHQDGRLIYEDRETGTGIDVRASFYATVHGENIVLRLLSRKNGMLLQLEDIGMAPRMMERFRDDALDIPSGVIIITGPTGSGKTTTLYSCINYLNDEEKSVITAEDPVEYMLDGVSQCSINPKINVTFEETLRHIVRQDPDIIVLGEIRDRFSAETAIQAALTGHKVLTTFHTEDSIGGLLRLLNMNIEAFLISSTVVCVVAQRLMRRLCVHCAEPYVPTPLDLRRLGIGLDALKGASFKHARGCSHCRFTGYRGRVGAFELLILNELVRDAILNRRTSYDIRRISLETSGLVTLVEDGLVKAARGETSLREVLRNLPRLHKPRSLQELRRLTGESR